jgi:type IV pilus assembly protein PilC
MKRYRYKAKDEKGNVVMGEVEAPNESHAAKLVRQRGLVVISIRSQSRLSLNFLKERVSMSDVTNFTRQLATMINAGLPITEALLILRSQANGPMSRIVAQILSDVEEGESLSAAIEKFPNVFSKTYVALIKSGELGGVMDEVLMRLASDMEKQEEFRGKVKGAMIYPAIIVVGMIGVGIIMIVFVVPRLTTLYEQFDAELPWSTKFLIGLSNIMIHFWPLVIVAVAALFWGFDTYRHTANGKAKIDEILFKIPLIGDLQRQIILADLTRTLSLMISSGVSILEGLTISSEVIANSVINSALKDIIKMVEKGFPLAFSFSRHPEAFPFILSQMVAVGEETGKMDEVLAKVSHVFEVESEQKVKALTAAIEPIILIVLGIGVAFLVLSIILPIYNLTTNMNIK